MLRPATTTRLLITLTLVTLPLHATAQQRSSKKYAEVEGWAMLSYSLDGGYMRCGAIAPGSGGAAVSFEKSSEGHTLLVPAQAKGDEAKGVVTVGGKRFSGVFYRMDDGRFGMFLKPAQLRTIESGKSMIVKIGAEEKTIALDGAGAALRKLSECDSKGGA